jgi:S-adenosylmethionine synthetase
VFPLKPAEIIEHLQLKYPRYFPTAAYGHFGRENELFTWEKTDMVEKLKSNID